MWGGGSHSKNGLYGDYMSSREQGSGAQRRSIERLIAAAAAAAPSPTSLEKTEEQQVKVCEEGAKATPSTAGSMDAAITDLSGHRQPPWCLCCCPRWTAHGEAAGAGICSFWLGALRVTILSDAAATCDAAWMFPTLAADALSAFPEGKAVLSFGAVLVQTSDGKNILLDTSIGCIAPPLSAAMSRTRPLRDLRTMLQRVGVAPDDIHVVCHSHLHRDHTSWNVVPAPDGSGGLVPTFPNAKHLVQRAEVAYWASDEALRARVAYDVNIAPLEASGQLQLVDGTYEVCAGVSLEPAPGHTPGHQICRLSDADGAVARLGGSGGGVEGGGGGGTAYFVGDLLHQVQQVAQPEWSPSFDWSATAAATTRSSVFRRLAAEGALLVSPHLPFPGVGRIERAGRADDALPASSAARGLRFVSGSGLRFVSQAALCMPCEPCEPPVERRESSGEACPPAAEEPTRAARTRAPPSKRIVRTRERATAAATDRAAAADAEEASASMTTFMITTNNVPYRQAAAEARAIVPAAYAVHHGRHAARAVTVRAPADLVHDLAKLTLPEKVYAIVCTAPAEALPPDDQLMPRLAELVARAPGWQPALAAHREAHGASAAEPAAEAAALSFAVRGRRRGTRYKAVVNDFTLGAQLGAALHARFSWRVDLTEPALEVTISLNDEGLLVSLALLRRNDAIDCKRSSPGLDPHVAWAMVRSLGPLPAGATVVDPMCGKGSLLFEALNADPRCVAIGMDRSAEQLAKAAANRAAVPRAIGDRLALLHGDASQLPLSACDALLCDLPFESRCPRFGHTLDTSHGATLTTCLLEGARALRPGSPACFLISQAQLPALREAMRGSGLRVQHQRPCPLGFTQAVIVLAARVAEAGQLEAAEGAEEEADELSTGPLPWESTAKRADWSRLRKAGRLPMVPW